MPLQQGTVLPRSPEAAVELFTTWSDNSSAASVGFAIEEIAAARLVGHVTLYGGTLPHRSATLAIILGGEHVGSGLGPAAIRVMLRYGFAELGLHRIQLQTWAFNDRALRAYAACGFVEEGRLRQSVLHDGRFHDQVLMAVLAEDWRAGGTERDL